MKEKWRKLLEREGVDVMTISGLDVVFYDCVRQFDRKTKEPFFSILENRILAHYLCIDPLAVGRKIYPQYFSSPQKIEKYYQLGLQFLKKVKTSTTYWKKNANHNTKEWQLQAFKEFREQFMHINYHFSIWPWWGIESWQADFEEMLSHLITKRKLKDRREQIIASVYKPWKKTAIIILQEKLQQGVPARKLINEFQFLRSWSIVWYRPIDEVLINNLKTKSKQGGHSALLSKPELYRLLQPNQREKWFLEVANHIIFFKDWRDDVRRTHVYEWSFLFTAIAQEFGVDRNDLGYLTLDEMEKALQSKIFPKSMVNFRKEHPCIITTADGSLKMKTLDHDLDQYLSIINEIAKLDSKETMVKGLIAQAGKVRGQVIIIKTFHDIKKVKKGDILIANTTHPNYLPGMQRAAAFITNEGGVISHAAIVARELKKPCIVGTKVATKIFKDGDLVEVDAYHGMVKKI